MAPEEAEEVILGVPLDIGLEVVNGEERSSHVGETNEGRILWIVITFRGERMRGLQHSNQASNGRYSTSNKGWDWDDRDKGF